MSFDQADNLAKPSAIRHGFFGRVGPSKVNFNMSTNLAAIKDDVLRNRTAACAAIGADRFAFAGLKQTHSVDVITLTNQPAQAIVGEADGLVTNRPGIVLGILTADCAPILFADTTAGIIGACHAGWRGAVNGIVGNTIAAMVQRGAAPHNIVAAIGPTISGINYEVGAEFAANITEIAPHAAQHLFTPPGGKPHFDLPNFIMAELAGAGVENRTKTGTCTFGTPERYFSHRHTTQHGSPAGRQIALITLVQ